MKNVTRIILICTLCIAILFVYYASVFIIGDSVTTHGSIASGESPVVSSEVYNTHEGELACLDGKLYYYFDCNDNLTKNGLFEISENASRIVNNSNKYDSYRNGMYCFQGNTVFADFVYRDDNMDTFPVSEGIINRVNPDSCSVELFSQLKSDDIDYYDDIIFDVDTLYAFAGNKIYASKDGKSIKPVFDKADDILLDKDYGDRFYSISGGKLVYISGDKHIKEYDFKSRKYMLDKKLNKNLSDNNNRYKAFTTEGKVFLEVVGDLYNLYCVTDDFKLVYSDKDFWANACYCADNGFYLGSDRGIDYVSADTLKTKHISSQPVDDIYVFGDKWIYYKENEDDTLFRISKDGKTTERVFGK